MRRYSLILLAAVFAVSCVDKGPKKKKISKEYIEENLLTAVPGDLTNTVNADLGGKIVYVGNQVEGGDKVAPGSKMTVVHYWRVTQAPGDDWGVFAHLKGAGKEWVNIDYTDMREGYPPSKWKVGDIIRDEQKFQVPDTWKSPQVKVVVGMWRKGGSGVEARMPIISGPKDGERGVVTATFKIDPSARPAPDAKAKPYAIRKVSEPITIDGKMDEEAWKKAKASPRFKVATKGPKVAGSASARMLYDDTNLYLWVTVGDPDVFSPFKDHDGDLWKADVLEMFIDADGNKRGYVELQINPNNTQLDIWFPGARGQDPDRLWSAGMTSAVTVRGTADDQSDADKGWDLEVAIPLVAARGRDDKMKLTLPPKVGDMWKLNVVRVDKAKGASNVSASSWSQIDIGDFHGLNKLLEVQFADADGKLPAAEPVAPKGDKAPAADDKTTPATDDKGATMGGQPDPAKLRDEAKKKMEKKAAEMRKKAPMGVKVPEPKKPGVVADPPPGNP
jgi:hypothetical protein